jgi:hypothetical protein
MDEDRKSLTKSMNSSHSSSGAGHLSVIRFNAFDELFA